MGGGGNIKWIREYNIIILMMMFNGKGKYIQKDTIQLNLKRNTFVDISII